jgi:hypothetical protein
MNPYDTTVLMPPPGPPGSLDFAKTLKRAFLATIIIAGSTLAGNSTYLHAQLHEHLSRHPIQRSSVVSFGAVRVSSAERLIFASLAGDPGTSKKIKIRQQ